MWHLEAMASSLLPAPKVLAKTVASPSPSLPSSSSSSSSFSLFSPRSRISASFVHERKSTNTETISSQGKFLLSAFSLTSAAWASSLASLCAPAVAAEEQLMEEAAATTSAVAAAASSSSGDTVVPAMEPPADTNILIVILAYAAFAGVAFVTIAVVYFAVSDFFDKRASEAEAKALEEVKPKKKGSDSLSPAGRGGAKGFGNKSQE